MTDFTGSDVLSLPASHVAFQASHSPLQRSQSTGEPYLPLTYRLPTADDSEASPVHFVLTPARYSDLQARVEQINDPSVDPWLWSPLKPYTIEAALERFLQVRKDEQNLFDTWARDRSHSSASRSDSSLSSSGISGLPLGAIRSRHDLDGTEVFLGELGVRREDDFLEIVDPIERERAVKQNVANPNGDPEILWTWFFSLGPKAAGKGLMTSVLQDVLQHWLVPVLNVHEMISFAFCGNEGSRRVHLKLGFEQVGTEWIKMPVYRGGQMREEWVFRWSLSKQNSVQQTLASMNNRLVPNAMSAANIP